MVGSFNYMTAPRKLSATEEKSLDNLRTAQSMGILGAQSQRQLQQLQRAASQSAQYGTAERSRLLYENAMAARRQAQQVQAAAEQRQEAAGKMQKTYAAQQQQIRADLGPWRQAGAEVVTDLKTDIAAGPGEYTKSPGYQARLEEGQKAITNRASMFGNVLSGATMKAATRFAQDYATRDYDNFLNRYYRSLQPKQQLAQMGQASAAQVGSQGLQIADLTGQAQQYAGEAAAEGTIGAANILAAQKAAAGERDYGYAAWKTGREF
ncbi:MAG: hypothetical protein DRZ76_02930 [Candidatus Nealsonbacteria bacterium]|nr:MAG: hypothetical protein DRZ76_02930 [Candidatus Nealsonbacteria bacterium]